MQLENISVLNDLRTSCYSVMTTTTLKQYLQFIQNPYKNKGGIEEQREPLKTSSALRIRKRMIDDILRGTILPPIVIGLIVNEEKYHDIRTETFSDILSTINPPDIAIIDGMQRTTALFDAAEKGVDLDYPIRIEFWVTNKIDSLVYRMLVLNTGQVPWNLRRQIEVVFRSMIDEISDKVENVELIRINDLGRRSKAGQFHASDIIELYLVFGARKEKIDTKERLSDEFTRLDFIEATESSEFTNFFYASLNYLGIIDKEFARYDSLDKIDKFNSGKDIFDSQPARVGFMTAIAKYVFGRPGTERNIEERNRCWDNLIKGLNKFTQNLSAKDSHQMETFLQVEFINEGISKKSSKIGDFEREYFTKAFDVLIELNFDVDTLEVCWRAY